MRTHRPDAGFSLAALIFFLAAASILIAAAVPAYQMQAKRQMEEELIFRGEEYARAIQKYQRRFGVYPTSVDQLVSTNNLRFLRRKYEDPITGKEFRLITINPDGSMNGSKVFARNVNTQSLFGNTQTFGQQQNPQQQQGQQGQGQGQGQRGLQPQQQNQTPGFGSQQPQSFRGGTGFTTPTTISAATGGAFGIQSPLGPQGQQGQQRGQPFGTTGTPAGQAAGAGGVPNGSSGIIGVASDSDKEAVKVYNNRQKYDEWEFIAILGQQAQQGQQGQQGLQGQPGQQIPGQIQPGGQRQNNPFQNAPMNPTGTPTGSPFGAGQGQRQIQTPFGAIPQPSPIQPSR